MPLEVRIAEAPALAESLGAEVEREAARVAGEGGRFTIAVPGGSVAEAFFPRLARARLDPERLDVFFVDERAVPPDSPDSNHGLARALWFDPAGIPAHRVHRMAAECADGDGAARAYAAALTALAGDPPRLDYVLLGVGPDGHVASLFPGHPLLAEETRPVAFLEDAPKPPPERMTLTIPVLAGARRVVVAALGGAKAPAVGEALREPGSPSPLAAVLRRAPRLLLLLDEAAARDLPPSTPRSAPPPAPPAGAR